MGIETVRLDSVKANDPQKYVAKPT
jgi:hypothetical protein